MSVTAERLMVEVQADVRQALRELDRLEGQTQKSQGRLGKMAKGLAAGFGAGAVAGGIAKTISLAKSFDLTIRQIGVQTGQTGQGLKDLGDLAMKMGADTAFSAQDASDAMLELAKGGLTAADIKAGALKDTLTLAAAGGLDMGSSATYMTQALNTFGLEAKDGAQIAAALAGGANASTASVDSLGQALSQVGPGASNAGMSIQETVAALAAFDNAGIKGSDAGTSLKTMLTSLVPATAKAKAYMDKYHMSFVNADGSMKSMKEVAGQLQSGLGGLNDKLRTQAMRAIFGSDATRAATVLMKEGTKGVEGYIKATKDQSTVQKMANTAMGGAEGAWNQFTGSVETLGIKLGTALLPAFTKAANGGAGFVNWLGTLGDELKSGVDWVKNFASGFLTALSPALLPVKALVVAIKVAVGAFWKVLQPITRGVLQHSKALGVVAGIIGAVFLPALVAMGVQATITKAKVVASWLAQSAAAVKSAALQGPAMVKMGVFYVQYAAVSTAQAAKVVASWVAQQVAVAKSVALQVAQMARVAGAYALNSAKMVASMAKAALKTAASWAMMAAKSLAQAARMAASWIIAMGPIGWAIAAVIAVVIAVVKNWDKIKAVTVKVWKAISGAVTAAWEWIKGAVKKAAAFVVNLFLNWSLPGLIIKHWDKIKAVFKEGVSRVVTFMKELPGKILSGLGNLGKLLWNAGKDILQGLLDGIQAMWGAVKGKLSELTDIIPDWKGPRSRDKKLLTPAGKAIMGSLMDGFQGSFPAIQKQLEGLTKRIEDTFSNAADRVNEKANAAISAAQEKLKGQAETAKLASIRKTRDAKLDQLSAEKDRLMDAAKVYGEKVDAFQGMVDSIADGFGDTWDDALKKFQELRETLQQNTTGKGEARWMKAMDKAQEKLYGLYQYRMDLVAKLETAQRRLDDLLQAKADFQGNVFSGMAGQANVTNAGSTAASIASSLTDQVAKVKRFSDALNTLRSMGFSDAVVMQVASAGVEGGWQAAQALVSASGAQVTSINSSMAAITDQATATSTALAGQMYDAGIAGAQATVNGLTSQVTEVSNAITAVGLSISNALRNELSQGMTRNGVDAAQGLINGLKSKKGELYDAAAAMGRQIAKGLRDELQIHSPSRVTGWVGKMTGKGLALGMLKTQREVSAASAELARTAVPAITPASTYAATQPTLAGLQGGQKAGAGVSLTFNTYNPVAEPQSRTTNKALDRAGSLGLV